MKEPVLKDQDLKLILKASIDYNSYALGIVAQVIDNSSRNYGANPKRVFRELERGRKRYENVLKDIMEKYDYNPASN